MTAIAPTIEPEMGPARVLVVDDSVSVRNTLRAQLEHGPLKVEIVEAADGVVGARFAVNETFDCVVCDLNMPQLDGFGFLRVVRQTRSRLELPVLLLTAADRVEDKVQGFRAGASDYLKKPCDPAELNARVETHVTLARMYRTLNTMVQTDALTGIANRRTFQQKFTSELARARRTKVPFSLGIADIDLFKSINDSCGHPAGDAVLVSVAKLLSSTHRPYDSVARIGGEEFAILLPNTTLERAVIAVERSRRLVESSAHGSLEAGLVHISIGVTEAPLGDDDTEERIYQRADSRLYLAKTGGRNRVVSTDAP